MPRKKKKNIIISIVVSLIILLTIGGVCIYLYLTTDAFKSNRTLFEKYLAQNFDVIQNIIQNKSNNIEEFLENNKYTSDISASINYSNNNNSTDSTSENNTDENQQSQTPNNINNLKLNINSQTDNSNQYDYKDIRLLYNTEKAARVEYIKENELVGIRLDGILQFVTIDTQDIESLSNKMNISEDALSINYLLSKGINVSELINFSDEEKQTMLETYTNIIEQNIPKENFKRINNQAIEVNENQVIANGYYIETTKEQYNNLLIKILEQVAQEEIILAKIDNIQNNFVEYGIIQDGQNISLRDTFIKYINNIITKIKNTNIGNEAYRIIVYESNGQTIRTVVETEGNSTEIDIYNNGTSITIQNNKLENQNETRKLINLENTSQDNMQNIVFNYEEAENNVYKRKIQIAMKKELQNNEINGDIGLSYEIGNNKVEITATENAKLVNEFENQLILNEENNITFNNIEEEQIANIMNILQENINNQINNITNKVTPEELNSMLKNLEFIKEDIFEEEEPIEITEIERNRFNSQLTFFIGEKQSADNINILLNAVATNLEDIAIENSVTDRGKEELNQITLNISRNSTNEEKLQEVREIIQENNREEYDVTMSYDEQTQLINRIFIRVHRDED